MFSDKDIKNSDEDLFDRKHFSERIAQIISSRTEKESIVIGIHAPWGEGKTSVLNMIVEKLDEHIEKKDNTLLDGHIVLLKFNPWRFSDENQLLENFFFALAEKLENKIETKGEKIADSIRKYSWSLAPLDAVKINFFGAADASLKVEETLNKIAESKPKADVETLKKRIEKVLDESSKKIVVMMDDIDRLDKEEIQAVFRLVKLSADFPNTIYVLSFDVERVSEALAEKYGSKEAGKSFLEKIIQLSLPLPPLGSNNLIQLTSDNINKLLSENDIELPKKEDADWSYFFFSTFGSYLKSPRLVKKFINNLWFSMPDAKNELNLFDLQTIEGVHTFFPDLYEIIRSNINVFLLEPSNPFMRKEEEKGQIEKLKQIVEGFPEQQKSAIKNIIQKLFPRTAAAFSNTHYGTDWYDTWEKEKRIASPNYFQRYFSIGISSQDISDHQLQQFIDDLINKSDERNVNTIRFLASNNREKLFLEKISIQVDNLEQAKAMKLAKAIALSGELFPKGSQDSLMWTSNPFSNAARLLRHLLENIKDEDQRLKFAVELASIISPLDFAYEFFRFTKYIGRNSVEREQEEKLTDLGKAIIDKVVERTEIEAEKLILEKQYPQTSVNLYNAWLFEKPDTVKNHLKERFIKNPQESIDFVMSFRWQSWDVNSVSKSWEFDFIISAIEKVRSDLELIPLENYTEDSNYMMENGDSYLNYFLSIAKKINPDISNQ